MGPACGVVAANSVSVNSHIIGDRILCVVVPTDRTEFYSNGASFYFTVQVAPRGADWIGGQEIRAISGN